MKKRKRVRTSISEIFSKNIVDEKLPVGNEVWDDLLRKQITRVENIGCNVDNLRRKFATLHRKKMQTGDLLTPHDV